MEQVTRNVVPTQNVRAFVLAGRAHFTMVNPISGREVRFEVVQKRARSGPKRAWPPGPGRRRWNPPVVVARRIDPCLQTTT